MPRRRRTRKTFLRRNEACLWRKHFHLISIQNPYVMEISDAHVFFSLGSRPFHLTQNKTITLQNNLRLDERLRERSASLKCTQIARRAQISFELLSGILPSLILNELEFSFFQLTLSSSTTSLRRLARRISCHRNIVFTKCYVSP